MCPYVHSLSAKGSVGKYVFYVFYVFSSRLLTLFLSTLSSSSANSHLHGVANSRTCGGERRRFPRPVLTEHPLQDRRRSIPCRDFFLRAHQKFFLNRDVARGFDESLQGINEAPLSLRSRFRRP